MYSYTMLRKWWSILQAPTTLQWWAKLLMNGDWLVGVKGQPLGRIQINTLMSIGGLQKLGQEAIHKYL